MLLISCFVFQKATDSSCTIIFTLCQPCWYVVSSWSAEFLHIMPLAEFPPTFFILLELLYHVHDLGLLAVCEKYNHILSDINSVWLGRSGLLGITPPIS